MLNKTRIWYIAKISWYRELIYSDFYKLELSMNTTWIHPLDSKASLNFFFQRCFPPSPGHTEVFFFGYLCFAISSFLIILILSTHQMQHCLLFSELLSHQFRRHHCMCMTVRIWKSYSELVLRLVNSFLWFIAIPFVCPKRIGPK